MSPIHICVAAAVATGAALVPSVSRAQTLNTLFSFDYLDGLRPSAGVIYHSGQLYGTTDNGGGRDDYRGTVFRISIASGKNHPYHFRGSYAPTIPMAGVILVNDLLYGTTLRGGGAGCTQTCGTVFEIDMKLHNPVVLHTFPKDHKSLGPYGGVIYQNGLLYGTTYGDDAKPGTVFSLDPISGTETILHSFTSGADGALPHAGLTYANGLLYGTTTAGGTDNLGTVFAVDPATQTETVLYSFRGHKDGAVPTGNLLYRQGDGLYGTTSAGGTADAGTVFKVNYANGKEHVLYSFTGGADGAAPLAALIDEKGTLYGTTSAGGGANHGTVFGLNPATGSEGVLYSFSGGSDGSTPECTLLYHAGAFYGTTSAGGGNSDSGTVFKLTP